MLLGKILAKEKSCPRESDFLHNLCRTKMVSMLNGI